MRIVKWATIFSKNHGTDDNSIREIKLIYITKGVIMSSVDDQERSKYSITLIIKDFK